MIFLTLGVVALLLSGCSGDRDNRYVEGYDEEKLTTLFLVDEEGFSYAEIPYKCDSMRRWSQTKNNGEFTFVQPDSCEFDFNGLDGVFGDRFDEVVRIVDYTYSGKGDIPYECSLFGVSSTYSDGSFDYDADDVCTFRL